MDAAEGRMPHDDYARIAFLYDFVTAAFLRAPRLAVTALCRELGVRRALDMGCGTGRLAAMLQEDLGNEAVASARIADVRRSAQAAASAPSSTGSGTSGVPSPASSPLVVGLDFSGPMLRRGKMPGAPFLVQGDAFRPPFAPGSFDALIYSLFLHETEADAAAILRQGFALAPLAILLEWRVPERNLDYPATLWVHIVERLAGKRHYRNFRRFMKGGGVHGLAARAGAQVLRERPLAGGSLVLTVLGRG